MTESILYAKVRQHLQEVHWVRLENIVSSGVPDVEGAASNRSVYLELKSRPRDTGVFVRPAQRIFWIERNRFSEHLWLLVIQENTGLITLHPCRSLIPLLAPTKHKVFQLSREALANTAVHQFKDSYHPGYEQLYWFLFTRDKL